VSDDWSAQVHSCTADIDDALVAAIHDAWKAEGIDPDGPPDPQLYAKSGAMLRRLEREQAPLLAELARRYRPLLDDDPDDPWEPDSAFLMFWFGEHGDKLHEGRSAAAEE
jgi:hypothetical protein